MTSLLVGRVRGDGWLAVTRRPPGMGGAIAVPAALPVLATHIPGGPHKSSPVAGASVGRHWLDLSSVGAPIASKGFQKRACRRPLRQGNDAC